MKYRYREAHEMKDSGVEWLGMIPKEWEVVKGKYVYENKKMKNSGNIKDIISLTLNGVIDRDTENLEGLQPESFDGYQEFYKNNLVFKLIDLENKKTSRVGIVHKNGLMSPAYIRLQERIRTFNKFYYYNYFDYYNKYIYNFLGSVGVRSAINTNDLLDMEIIKINYNEQEKIATFLDQKTSEFDTIIEKKQSLITKLTEAKKSLISEVVMGKKEIISSKYQGLSIRDRNNEDMKDSGVEWLGMIPKEWEVKKIKYLFEIQKRISGEEGYDVLSITQQGIKIKDITSGGGQLSMDYSKYQFVYPGDFAMNHMDLITGFVDLSKYFGVTSPDYRVFSLKNRKNISEYFLLLFQIGYRNKIFFGFGQGSSQLGRWRFPTEAFNDFYFPYPNIEEQKRISDFINEKIAKIDKTIEKTKVQIEKLKEAKQSLISEAVTGKVEVL